jgi:hypothetical protein
MRFTRLQLVLAGVTGLTAVFFIGLAVAAGPLGLSTGAQWGRSRVLLAQAALVLVIFTGLIITWRRIWQIIRNLARPVTSSRLWPGVANLLSTLAGSKPIRWLGKAGRIPGLQFFRRQDETAARLLTLAIFGLALAAYLFFQTAGLFTFFRVSDYFDMQAEAFLNGQAALLLEPDPRLAQVANPYDYRQREQAGISTPWDISYYRGKYYLYWGPAPALAAAGLRLITGSTVDDQFLLLGSLIGVQALSCIFLLMLRRRFFPGLQAGLLALPLLAITFTPPVLYILNRPSVYEAAIMNGQLGLIAGVLCAFTAGQSGKPARWMFLAGLCWAYAFNSRVTLLVAVGFMALVFGWLTLRANQTRRFQLALALLLPLALGAAGLGLFNLARFGSPFEPGWRYQFTGDALPADPSAATSLFYIPANLYAYLLRPLKVDGVFPFLTAPWKPGFPAFLPVSELYYPIEPTAGIFFASPIVLATLLSMGPILKPVWNWLTESAKVPLISATSSERALAGVALALLGGGLLAFVPVLLFIVSSMRYEMDFLPLILLAAGLGWLWAHSALAGRSNVSRLLDWLGGLLILVTVLNGLLLGFSGYNNRIESVNTSLYYGLIHFFSR